jgi:CHAT domain-containing protein
MNWSPLPGTREEALAIRDLLPDVTLLMGDLATESALKAVAGPSLLHVATHGFFLEDEPMPREPESRGGTSSSASNQSVFGTDNVVTENPLLRSGLLMAGANHHAAGEDGILTALEVSGLDLSGTRLVVLSACETGVGDIRNAEGVFGLRRALVLAGSESQLMSLWNVSDEAGRDLMVLYYSFLAEGLDRSQALRQVQLEWLASDDLAHPFLWAGFIQLGSWKSLSLDSGRSKEGR